MQAGAESGRAGAGVRASEHRSVADSDRETVAAHEQARVPSGDISQFHRTIASSLYANDLAVGALEDGKRHEGIRIWTS